MESDAGMRASLGTRALHPVQRHDRKADPRRYPHAPQRSRPALAPPTLHDPRNRSRFRNGARIPPHNPQAGVRSGRHALLPSALAAAAETGVNPDEFYQPARGHNPRRCAQTRPTRRPHRSCDPRQRADRDGLLDATGGVTTLISLQVTRLPPAALTARPASCRRWRSSPI
jgi:hypothetical protein